MENTQFYNNEPILINKIAYRETSRDSGRYVFNPSELAAIIQSKKDSGDVASLDQIVRELFSICNQGRRPWSVEAEGAFLALARIGCDLISCLRTIDKVTNETYKFIDPLSLALRLGHEAEQLEKIIDPVSNEDRPIFLEMAIQTLPILYQLIDQYISIFCFWATDYPNEVTLPSRDSLQYLLETGDDDIFSRLLSAAAKTRSLEVKEILLDFLKDDEYEVRELAQKLLTLYW